ncbi:MAG: hypothetical protein DRK00_08540 [Thermoprotei archaeon]|nr:MAG: hypothetical protein DRK00_08540 [Thermoprotei archaeon]
MSWNKCFGKLYRVKESSPGYVILEDGTFIVIRVVIGFIEEVGETPTGPDLRVAHRVFLYVEAPERLKAEMRYKPLSTGEIIRRKEIWEVIGIKDRKAAYEECVFKASDGKTYRLRLEFEPSIVARTLQYRDANYNPVYYIRWNVNQSLSLAE